MSFIIDSSKRTSGQPNNFLLQLKYPLSRGQYRLALANIPYTIQTIDDRNKTFLLNSSPVTLTEGNYNTSTLGTELQNKLNSVSSGFVVSVSNDFYITIQNSSLSFTLDFTEQPLLAETLGFEGKQYPSTNQITGSAMINLTANSNFVGIVVKDVETNQIRGSINQLYSFVIPQLAERRNSYTKYLSMGHFIQQVSFPRDVSKLEVLVVDRDEKPINLRGINWYMILSKV